MGASSTPLITLKSKLEFDSKYTISNLWNGTEDTISDASNKGGNQVIIYLTGNVNNNLLVQSQYANLCECICKHPDTNIFYP